MERARLAVPKDPEAWLADRRDRLGARLKELGKAARAGTIPSGTIEHGELHIEKLEAAVPEGVEQLVLDLYGRLPRTRITDLLLEVDTLRVSRRHSSICAPARHALTGSGC